MNTYRYDEEKRKQWVRDKITRAKTVKQICREARISRATLYNWLDEFKHLETELTGKNDDAEASSIKKASRPELLQKTSPETGERYRMLVSAISGIDANKVFSKKLVALLVKRFTLTVPQACAVVGIDESVYGYKPRKPETEDYIVYEALINLIQEDRRRDFETCYTLLLKRHPDWTRKQIKRVYRDGMVYLERQRSNTRWEKYGKAKSEAAETTVSESLVASPSFAKSEAWHLALLEYSSALDGQTENWWLLCIVDETDNTILNARAGVGQIATDDILQFLDKAATQNGTPRKLKIPGKPALAVRELTRWVWQHKMALHTFSLNKPENLTALERMESQILDRLNENSVTTRQELMAAAETLIERKQV